MIFKWLYLFLNGYVNITVEGFFVERFINICISKKIILQELHRQKSTILKAKITKSDFKKIRHIARKTKCRVHIDKKVGIPFLMNQYRKRKVFAIAIGVMAIFLFMATRFIWNIEVEGLHTIPEEEILAIVREYGIDIGKLKNQLETEKVTNAIRMERDDISWIGITIKGTNAIVTVEEATEKPKVIDTTQVCNIISDKDAIISKMIVQNGTARVAVGDTVKPGDILVEGIMEGTYTGMRQVHAEADIYGKIYYEKEKKESLIQEIEVLTGNEEKKSEIYIHNFKINFHKGVSKFKNYDTIKSYKKIKLFSNYYIPIEMVKITYKEFQKEYKTFTEEELQAKIEEELTKEIEKQYHISQYPQEDVEKEVTVQVEDDGINVKVSYAVQQKIGTSEEVVF